MQVRGMDFLTDEERLLIKLLKGRMDETNDKTNLELYHEKIMSLYNQAELRFERYLEQLEQLAEEILKEEDPECVVSKIHQFIVTTDLPKKQDP